MAEMMEQTVLVITMMMAMVMTVATAMTMK